jgi:ATP-dependent helicase HrpA
VVSGAHFASWWKQERRRRPNLLPFDPAMLVREDAAPEAGAFPDVWAEDRLALPLSYHFEPGHYADGVTIDVPLATLNAVGAAPFSWQVPGMRADLVVALVRSLPKQLRVNFVPVPDVARAFLAAVPPGEEPLTEALGRYLRARTGVHVPAEAWDWAKVPAHLRPTFRVVDEDGTVVAEGKDLDALKEPLRPAFERAMSAVAGDSELTATGQRSWTFGVLPEAFRTMRGGHEVQGYPALVDEGETVGVRVLGRAETAAAYHRRGVRRLLVLAVGSPADALLAGLDNARKLALAGAPGQGARQLLDDCVLAAAGELVDGAGPVRDPDAFVALVEGGRQELAGRSEVVLGRVVRALADWRETDRALQGRVELPVLPAMTDLQAQLGRLVHPGFVAEVGAGPLAHYPRYLAAMRVRRDKLAADPARDRLLQARIEPLQQAWQYRLDALPEGEPPDDVLVTVRWLLEELRVSLWAQQLGTPVPVSEARIRRLLD